jgi:GST-like protein
VLDKRLGEAPYLAGDYGVADIAVFPWTRSYARQGVDLAQYPNVQRWFEEINARPAVQRGLQVLADRRKAITDEQAREYLFGKKQYERH